MDSFHPFFSIIIPVYNRERIISTAVQSVLDQSYRCWELIIIDDGSTDNTANRVLMFKDSRIQYFKNPRNQGPSVSRNLGIKNAKGKVISFLDSDDRYYPDFLEKTYQKLWDLNMDVGFIWTGLDVQYPNERKNETWSPEIKISPYYTFLKELRIGTNSGLSIRKEVFENCGGFNENLTAAEDTEFLLRIVKEYKFSQLEEPLIFIDKSGSDRLSLNYEKNAASYNQFIGQHWEYILKYPELKKKFYYKLMWLNYHLSDKNKARFYFREFVSDFGLDLKVLLVFLIFEIFGSKLGSKIHIVLSR